MQRVASKLVTVRTELILQRHTNVFVWKGIIDLIFIVSIIFDANIFSKPFSFLFMNEERRIIGRIEFQIQTNLISI